jgi:DNA-directed RNA polymerase III subunit RPC2
VPAFLRLRGLVK